LRTTTALLVLSFICFFIAIYLGGMILAQIDIAPRMQIIAWATTFFIGGIVILLILLISRIAVKELSQKT
jgi:hypothetical protein